MLKVHPAAELFPLMSPDELKVLGEDIQKNGLQHPVVLWSPGDDENLLSEEFLLDGRNRLDAMELVGIQTVENGQLSIDDLHNPSFSLEQHLFEFRRGFDDDLKDIRLPDTDPYAYGSPNIKPPLTADRRGIIAERSLNPTVRPRNREAGRRRPQDSRRGTRRTGTTWEIPVHPDRQHRPQPTGQATGQAGSAARHHRRAQATSKRGANASPIPQADHTTGPRPMSSKWMA